MKKKIVSESDQKQAKMLILRISRLLTHKTFLDIVLFIHQSLGLYPAPKNFALTILSFFLLKQCTKVDLKSPKYIP